MTKERRAEIEALVEYAADAPPSPMNTDMVNAMRELLADCIYWQNAVRTAHEPREDCICFFCSQDCLDHRPDCPWLRAQEETT